MVLESGKYERWNFAYTKNPFLCICFVWKQAPNTSRKNTHIFHVSIVQCLFDVKICSFCIPIYIQRFYSVYIAKTTQYFIPIFYKEQKLLMFYVFSKRFVFKKRQTEKERKKQTN